MIDFSTETPLSLQQAAEHAPGQPHISTLHRWCRRGIRGVRLETRLVGGKRFTTIEALSRFFAAATEASDGVSIADADPPSHRRQKQVDHASRKLDLLLGVKAETS